jgi:signal transduction histidine kinase
MDFRLARVAPLRTISPCCASLEVRLRGHRVAAAIAGGVSVWLLVAASQAGRALAALLVAGLVAVSLAVGRRWPVVALGVAFVGLLSVDRVEGGRPLEDAMLAVLVLACFLVGRWARPVLQPWAAAGVLLLIALNVIDPGDDVSVGDVVFPTLLTAAPWLLGLAVQLSSHRADRATSYAAALTNRHEQDVHRATDQERLRIALELHDLVAHHLSGLSLQTQVIRRRVEAGGSATPGELTAIEESARSALIDLRRVLGVLRATEGPPTAPQESLADLDELIEHCRHAGQTVRVETVGTPRELPLALSLVAYRVLQEALTNARRHGNGRPTSLRLEWQDGRLVLLLSNPYDVQRPVSPGHGLIGLAERARLFGGTVTTLGSSGVWTVEVTLPTPDPVPEATR